MRSPRRLIVALFAVPALGLGACPGLPEKTVGDTPDTTDGEVFVPLSFDRLMESVGEPAGGERIALYGAGFLNGSELGLPEVTFGAAPGESVLVLDDGQINVTVPSHDAGLVDVTLTLPDGQSATLEDGYLYRGPLRISAVSPAVGTGGALMTVSGEGFDGELRVLVGGRMLMDVRKGDDGTLTGVVPARLAQDVEAAATVDVIVTNGFEQRTLERAFTYVTPLELTGLDPISGPSVGGTLVTLRGHGLSMDTVVRFGATPAENVEVVDEGRDAAAPGIVDAGLVVRAPPGAHGTTDVSADNVGTPGAGGVTASATLPAAFYNVDEARLPGTLWAGHLFPAQGPVSGGTEVALSVRGLTSGDGVSVHFGQSEATISAVRVEEGAVVVAVPPGRDAGTVVVVLTKNGVSTSPLLYTYVPDFELTGLDPAFVPLGGGDVKLVGAGLTRDVQVTIGGKLAPVSSTSGGITVRAPASVPGSEDVRVVLGDRAARLPAGLEYRSERSKLWAISPELGAQSGGRIVRFFGEGFQAGAPKGRFGDEDGSERVTVDDHVAIIRAPRGDPGNVNVGGGDTGRLAKPYRYYDPSQRFGGTSGGTMPEALNITVLDAVTHEGVPDAYVLLWTDIDGPYQGLTDDRGQITFSDVYFGPMQMVTASADDYTTGSIVEFDARDATLNLIPLRPSNPGGGGGGGGPQPLGPSVLSGKVVGFDKYVVTPPGSCEARLGRVEGALCAPCASDDECGGGGNLCSPLGKEGARCTTPCEVHGDCPNGFMCAGVEGGNQCVPSAGRRTARCSVTLPDVFSLIEVPLTPTNADSVYSFGTDPGEYAVVCLGGVEDDLTGDFTPLVMGVRRHVFAQPDTAVSEQDVTLDIPLSRTLRIRLDGAPTGRPKTKLHTAQVFVNLGADGVFLMPEEGRGIDQNVFELDGFPAAFAESLYDASLTVYATAVKDAPAEEQIGVGSFVVQDGISELFSDAVFELGTADGIRHRATGMSEPIYGMTGLEGSDRLWAVGEGGRVAAFDGTLWGLQQTATTSTLRGVWAAGEDEVWAVGDAGAVQRFDGLVWLPVAMPASIARAAWWGVAGVVAPEGGTAAELWAWGERGVWKNAEGADAGADAWQELDGPARGSIKAVGVVSPGEAWMVGAGGAIERWQNGVVTSYDMPGGDLNAVAVVRPDLVWAVGDEGRILRWDGTVWFELLPVTARSLRGVSATRDDRAWAVGDAGEVVRWDGVRWKVQEAVPHSDLFAIGDTPSGRVFAAGVATLIIGPFMQLPRPANPNAVGNLTSLDLRWVLDPGADASFNWVDLLHPSGFPFWQIVADGPRRDIPLPDLQAAWGLQAMWPGDDYMSIYRVYVPGFDMGAWDESILTPYRWRSWAREIFSMTVPEPDL